MGMPSGALLMQAAGPKHFPTINLIRDLRRDIHSMKPHIEKLSDHEMRFFTADLFLNFNSPDDQIADRADEEWEVATRSYQEHLDRMGEQMPTPVRKLAGLCLHDGELLADDQLVDPFLPENLPPWSGITILSIRREDEIVLLIYVLGDPVKKHEPDEAWPFSRRRTHWLYDEVDLVPDSQGLFVHRILFSDGSTLKIPFISVLVHNIPLRQEHPNEPSRQIA